VLKVSAVELPEDVEALKALVIAERARVTEREGPAGRGAWAQGQLLDTVEGLGAIPEVAFVSRPSL
jgi:hypothetical protein